MGYSRVDKRCDVLAACIRMGAAAHDLTELELIIPRRSAPEDPVNVTGHVIENILEGKVKKTEWGSLEGIEKEGALFIDVRSDNDISVSTIKIEGFERIPLEELRSRLSGLDRENRYSSTAAAEKRDTSPPA